MSLASLLRAAGLRPVAALAPPGLSGLLRGLDEAARRHADVAAASGTRVLDLIAEQESDGARDGLRRSVEDMRATIAEVLGRGR